MVHKYIVLRRGYVTVECGPVEDRPTDRLLGCVCEESAGPTDRQGGGVRNTGRRLGKSTRC